MDTCPGPQQQLSNDIRPVYRPSNGLPHTDIISQAPMTSRDMSGFPSNEAGPSNATNGPGPIHVGMGDVPNSVKMSVMHFLESATPTRASAPNFIPDFPSANGFGAVSHLNNHTTTFSSPSGASSISGNLSHLPSPSMQGTSTNYSGTSSLASALDSVGDSRSRSGSSASPGNFVNAKPDFSYSSTGNTSVRSSPEFHFPPSDTTQERKRGSPDVPTDSHLMAIGGLLAK
jgi:hypothetical protein